MSKWVPSITYLLILHAEMRSLSRGKLLTQLFILRKEIKLFFQQQNNPKFQELLLNIEKVARLADIFMLN